MKSNLTLLFGLMLFSTLHAQIPAYVPTDGLVGWWPFNGNANDESGNGNDGLVNGATSADDRFGIANNAYSFDGVDDFIEVTHNLDLNALPLTISVWFNVDSLSNGQWLVGKYGCASANGYSAHLISGKPSAFYYSGDSNNSRIDLDVASTEFDSYQDELWHHAVLIFDNEGLSYFIDGNQITSVNFIGEVDSVGVSTSTEAPLLFGRYLEGGCFNLPQEYFFLNGFLDDIAIWNRALSYSEVVNLYTGQCPDSNLSCTSLPSNLQQNLVGYWPFCGNANDESGNGNDGVVNGATLTEDRFGNANAAYSFDGSYDYIATQFDGSSSLTASVWMNSEYPISWYPQIIRIGGVEVILQLGVNSFYVENNMVGAIAGYPDFIESSPYNASFNTWHHIVMVHDHDLGLRRLYIDNQLVVSGVTTDFIQLDNSLMTFGNSNTGFTTGSAGFLGALDDIAIWDRALTEEEVQELYTLNACTFTIYDTLTVENVINVYDTLTIENIVDIFDTTYINVEVYDTLTVENIINVYDTLTIENIVEVYDTLTIENVIDVYDTTAVVETEVVYDTLTIENIVEVYDTLTIENVIDVYDTTTFVETITVYDTLTVENVVDVYDTTYVTVTDTLIIDIPSGVGGTILNTLLLYPNPTSDQLTISYGNFAAMAGYSLTIFDNGGSTVHETNITQAQETLDISQWSAGVYQVVVYNAGGVPVETRQIVIQ